MGWGAARLYEPVLGRLLGGVRAAVLELCPPRPGMRVVDVGCGTGALLVRYAAAGCRVAGIDTSRRMLAEARRRLGPDAVLVEAGAGALPFADGSADLVVATMVLHTLPEEARVPALGEMARVAGGAGRVAVADHRPGPAPGLAGWWARQVGRALEGAAGHAPGVRSLAAFGGAAGLAASAGLVVEAEALAGAGTLVALRLRRGRERA